MNLLFIDVETTGFPKNSAVIEIACIPVIDGIKQKHFHSYIKPHPGAYIDPKAMEVNKIDVNLFHTFPEANIVLQNLIAFIDSFECPFTIAGHNAPFDRDKVHALFSRNAMYGDYITRFSSKTVCTMEMAKRLIKEKSVKYSLKDLCARYSIKLDSAHSALPDIQATVDLYDILKTLEMAPTRANDNLSYPEKKKKYFDSKYIQINPDGTIYMTTFTMNDPVAIKFIFSELWALYAD